MGPGRIFWQGRGEKVGTGVQKEKACGLGNDMGWRQDPLGYRVGWSEVGERMTKSISLSISLPGKKAAIMEVAR